MGKCSEVCLGAKREVLERELALRQYFVGLPEDSCLNMKTPVAPLEDPPYTLSMTATITSQHSIEKVQSNCTLSSVEYLGSAKTSVQVTNENTAITGTPTLGSELDPYQTLSKYLHFISILSRAFSPSSPQLWASALVGRSLWMQNGNPNVASLASPQLRFPWLMGTSLTATWNS